MHPLVQQEAELELPICLYRTTGYFSITFMYFKTMGLYNNRITLLVNRPGKERMYYADNRGSQFFSTFDVDAVENIDAHVVYGYVIHDNDSGNTVSLSYPLDENKAVMTGRSFHHGRFVMGLRKEARKCGYVL